MTRNQIDSLLKEGEFPEVTGPRELIETHISWVILCDQFVYKIKKPIKYSFLDFSTIAKRKQLCEKELQLNQRFAKDIYLEVLPIHLEKGCYSIGGHLGRPIDYVLKMRKLDPQKRMDVLLKEEKVTSEHIKQLAQWIANFHKRATIVYNKDVLEVKEMFNDLAGEKAFLSEYLHSDSSRIIDFAINASERFLDKHQTLLNNRLRSGLFRDCHGDLHSRNIFLTPDPQPFDCLEFNDDYRQIDVLNEVAFLCMDLDAFGRKELSNLCIQQYNLYFPAIRTQEERKLFMYYKGYRANVRAKVNSLRARSALDKDNRKKALAEVTKYLGLMETYLQSLEINLQKR